MIPPATKRRTSLLAATLLIAALALTACSGDGDDSGAQSDSDTAGYPVTLDTAYGEITLDEKPERIIALKGQFVDQLTAIDVQPVAFYAAGGRNSGTGDEAGFLEMYPWLDGAYTGEFDWDLVGSDNVASLEEIANYEPDLIVTDTDQVDEQLYEQISDIAPTFVGVEEGINDWDVTFEALGKLTGEEQAVADAMADMDAEYAEARQQLPGLQGKTYNAVGFYDSTLFFFNGSWMEGLGLTPADNQENSQTGEISLENIDQLDADAIGLWFTAPELEQVLDDDPRYQELPASRNGTVLAMDQLLVSASSDLGPHSLTWTLERVLPQLEQSALNTSGE